MKWKSENTSIEPPAHLSNYNSFLLELIQACLKHIPLTWTKACLQVGSNGLELRYSLVGVQSQVLHLNTELEPFCEMLYMSMLQGGEHWEGLDIDFERHPQDWRITAYFSYFAEQDWYFQTYVNNL